ncbi:diaminobutyrate--2-oxoglutarate transaminase [Nonomuraea diastatica]|uniref:Diaminobutyrate--2-oxoglutarate transaminase n=1 Tax=Nonomuraea diastatica TaxID=1848329 RepID=A0A4R4WLJ1_9ACTN|nr:diaminobutyrate--2-oxoglutarate transaminase [Nonomuraea diastatica]TDD14610.1 diaminobutyrate--2-oxoglutarate transaminase [Nonomuraea diastatica]
MVTIFDELESNVRTYCRRFPAVFVRARGHVLWDQEGRSYIDFLSGAGALNYGHNHPAIKAELLDYLAADGPVHTMDLHTEAKAELLRRIDDIVLRPRGLAYRVQFTGPTGANAIEAALKVARRATGRTNVIAFTNGFHGMSLGALALAGNLGKRAASGVPLDRVTRLPYDGYLGQDADTVDYLEKLLDDPGSGIDPPAAIVLETVQGEGGLNVARPEWLRRVEKVAHDRGIVLIVDDIQAGCGRTGSFFSFEEAGLRPDIVCLAKSISGYGLPLALTLIRPDLDLLGPGEHSGTFRGHNLAFVTASAALGLWSSPQFTADLDKKCLLLAERVRAMTSGIERGRGLLRGLFFAEDAVAAEISLAAFSRGLLLETSGAANQVVKIMPPLIIDDDALHRGMDILDDAVQEVLSKRKAGTR